MKQSKRNNSTTYKDEKKHSKHVSNVHFIHEIEYINHLSPRYTTYWKEMKRRCMEGYWHDGKWMPGNLYFYINFCLIEISENEYSKSKVEGKPFLRDLEWEKAYVFAEARGFSGFAEDTTTTCFRDMPEIKTYCKENRCKPTKDENSLHGVTKFNGFRIPNSCFRSDGRLKAFKEARKYLRTIHSKNYGKPLYENDARNVIDFECRGCLSEGTRILMKDGSTRAVEDLNIGDLLMGKDGTSRAVLQLHSGTDDLYKIKHASTAFEDRIVNSNHRISVQKRKFINGKYIDKVRQKGHYETEETDVSIRRALLLQAQAGFTNNYYRYKPKSAVTFIDSKVNIDPYYLGLWLSDGRSNCTSIKITDPVLWEYLETFAKINSFKYKETLTQGGLNRKDAKEYYYKDVGFRELFKSYNLLNNKHIPEDYKTTTIESRMSLLEGLIDGDGTYDKKSRNIVIYAGVSKLLADDILFICRSLGFHSSLKVRRRNGCQVTYEITLSGNLERLSPKLARKNAPPVERRNDYNKSSFTIEPVGTGKYYGLVVDKDNEYLLNDFSVDHNSGKSFWAGGGMIACNFITDGCYDYDDFQEKLKSGKPATSTTLVGAIDSFYSKSLLAKVQLSMDKMLGSQEFQGVTIPSPLRKDYSGSWNSGDQTVKALVDKEIGGRWLKVGSNAKIIHKTFKDKPTAGNGARASVACFEEVGFFDNLADSLSSIKDTTYNGGRKFGTIYMFGTGGVGDQENSQQAKDVFYDPESYDCLGFDDIFEDAGTIGYFVPYELGLNEYKDEEGITDLPEARAFIEKKRNKVKNGKKKDAYLGELLNNPQTHSEAFLMQSANIFPTGELKEQLGWVRSHQEDNFVKGMYGTINWVEKDGKQEAKFLPDTTGLVIPTRYRMKKEEDCTGCIHIWEMPQMINGSIPHGLYIAGTDPYDQDQSVATSSLGSTFIYKTFHTNQGIYNWPVAEYTARPENIFDHHENVRKLLTLYNAVNLYENERNSIKMHFEHRGSLHLLARTPEMLKANEGSKVNRVYGQHMTQQVKDEIEIYLRNWLMEDAGNGKLNLNMIYSVPLLEELINYNREGNFDRVIAFMLVILHKLMNYHIKVEEIKNEELDPFFTRGNSGKFF